MADALVSFVVEQLATVIKNEIEQEVRLVVGVQKEIAKLTITFKAIQAVIIDAQQRQIQEEYVKIWLEEFKDVTYDIDDVLDEWSTQMLIKRSIRKGPANIDMNKVHSFLNSLGSCYNKVALRHDIGSRIKAIRERVVSLDNEKDRYRLVEIEGNNEGLVGQRSSSLIDVSDVCGRSVDKHVIITSLLGESSSTRQQQTGLSHPIIISVVGMGGLGKTTLAQLVFNDQRVKSHFKMAMWVWVSKPFNLTRLAQAIIQEAGLDVPSSTEWNSLHNSLSRAVKQKRFLLVLDDVWNDDYTKWEPLQLALRSSAQGSRILVTTRNVQVSRIMNTTDIHYLETLPHSDCWSIIQRRAFVDGREDTQGNLHNIGKKIAEKCNGLPLAAKTLGSLLHFKTTHQEWQNVLESRIWELQEHVENCFLKPALLLSYYDLPAPLKGCFAYCSIFPKGHNMSKDVLIKSWMAQGFLNSPRNLEPEMIGEEYFNHLVMRSFFHVSKDYNGNIVLCKMHDILHEFAHYLTKSECCIVQNNNTHFLNHSSKMRHLSLICEDTVYLRSLLASICKVKNLRTFQLRVNAEKSPLSDALSECFLNLRCLRVLFLDDVGLHKLPSEIGKLIHLRYLDLSYNDKLKELPELITNLYNLQTLILKGCGSLCKLPQGMWRLVNLRHLTLELSNSLTYLPRGFGKLTSLQSLDIFTLSGATMGCTIKELKGLNHLKGNLSINGLGSVKNVDDAFEAELGKKNLTVLTLNFKVSGEANTLVVDRVLNGVLEGLQPQANLKELHIYGFEGSKLPNWITNGSLLLHLQSLELRDCINCIALPALGLLPSLRLLKVNGLNSLKQIGLEIYGNGHYCTNSVAFPKLEHLEICEKDGLEVLDLGYGKVMPCLRYLKLVCPKMKYLPALGRLPSLEILSIEAAEVTDIGVEFYGINTDERVRVAFPMLKELKIDSLQELEEWDFGVLEKAFDEHKIFIMPRLVSVTICNCNKLRTLRALSKLPSLEELHLLGSCEMKHTIGREFYGGAVETNGLNLIPKLKELTLRSLLKLPFLALHHLLGLFEMQHGIGHKFYGLPGADFFNRAKLFPKLKVMSLSSMYNLEEWANEVEGAGDIMPRLVSLVLKRCQTLKSLPQYLLYLEELELDDCSSLSRLPSLPRLKTLTIKYLKSPTLPQGLENLKKLQELVISFSHSLTYMPEEVIKNLTSLRQLKIFQCKVLKRRCAKNGEDWGIISHIPNIFIDGERIQGSN